jgi:hypothetical protein
MTEWKPDRSGQFLTVVYKDVVPGDEVGALHEHPKACAMSWSNALHDVDYLRNRLPTQKPWVGLTDEEKIECSNFDGRWDCVEATEAKLKEKNNV